MGESALRVKPAEDDPHPLSPSIFAPRRSASFTLSTTAPSPQAGYFDSAHVSSTSSSHTNKDGRQHRHHAASISVVPPRVAGKGRVSQADLLGVGPSRRPRSIVESVQEQPITEDSSAVHDLPAPKEIPLGPRSSRPSISSTKPIYIDSLSKEDAAVLEMRFDMMTDEELGIYLSTLFPLPSLSTGTSSSAITPSSEVISTPVSRLPHEESIPDTPRPTKPKKIVKAIWTDDDASPLFPPSPPSDTPRGQPDHPLRILARAVQEMKERIENLEEENEKLRTEISLGRAKKSRDRKADEASIHDGLTEALSTSLNTPSSFPQATLQPTVSRDSTVPRPSSSSIRRSKSPASSISAPFPASPIIPSSSSVHDVPFDPGPNIATPRRQNANRASWTSSLWVWNKKQPRRKGSVGSLASMASGQTARSAYPVTTEEEEEDHSWRKPEGNTPSFKAIFLATRIITPDPSSILSSPSIPSNSLIAYLAHSLVSNARDEGISIMEAPRRNSRSRATSVTSTEAPTRRSGDPDTPVKGTKASSYAYGYGDTALAMGKSLLSSVSSATLRSTKSGTASTAETHPRPSLLSRVSFSKPFPTTAVSPPSIDPRVSISGESPDEELPLPSVELANIAPNETRPPTVLLSRQNLGNFFQSTKAVPTLSTASRFKSEEPPLTDRYGFIYDIQHASMLKDASAAGTAAPASLNGTLPSVSSAKEPKQGVEEGWVDKRRKSHERALASPRRSIDSSRTSVHEVSTEDPTSRAKTPDISPPNSRSGSNNGANGVLPTLGSVGRHRSPSTVPGLNLSPARPVTGKDNLTVSARGSSSLVSNISNTASPVSPLSASLAKMPNNPEVPDVKASRATVSSLLDQLTEIHDRQQQERKTQWDAFLRKRQRTMTASKAKKGETFDRAGLIGINQMSRSSKNEEWKAFSRLVRGGIPLAYRSEIWAECSGAKDLMVPGEYVEILEKRADEDSPVLADIEKDVSRTFPGNVFFGGDGHGVAKLRRVLVAYSWHNPSVGYCQGMNMLAATLLLTHTEEEDAYWTLLAIIERLLPPTFFSPTLLASRADQMVLDDLVKQLVPKVSEKLAGLGVDLASITFGWFLSLFTDCLPVETLFRVWDVFFVEGRDILFRVAIAIIKLNEQDILAASSVSDLFEFVGGMTSRLWAADKLIALQHSYKGIIRHGEIESRAEKYLASLESG